MMVDFGTDYNWDSSPNKLETVSNNENVLQAIRNRLNTRYEELDWIYDSYGSNFTDYTGEHLNDENINFIENSIRQSLDEEERLTDYTLSINLENGKVVAVIKIDEETYRVELTEES